MGGGSKPSWRWLQIAFCASSLAIASFGKGAWLTQSQPSPSAPPIFSSERNEVEVVVIVRDGSGQPVSNLKQSDFEIRDNGKLQTISGFAIQGARQPTPAAQAAPAQAITGSPITGSNVERRFVALFFDDVHTEFADFARVQKAAERFVQESLQPEDRVAIFKTSENGEVTFTNNKQKLLSAISALHVHPVKSNSQSVQCPRMSSYEAYQIVNHLDPDALTIVAMRLRDCMCPPPAEGCPPLDDLKTMTQGFAEETWQTQKNSSQDLLAALDLTVRVLGTMPGRRMLVLSSSGFISGDLDRNVDRVIDNALRGGVVINALSAKGLYAETPGGSLSEQRSEGSLSVAPRVAMYESREFSSRMQAENVAMIDFAESTGGRFFKNNNDLLHGLNDLAAPETSYVLAFSPHPLKHDGKFHKLKINVKASGKIAVFARRGYFAPTEKEVEAELAKVPSSTPLPVPKIEASAPAATKPPDIPSQNVAPPEEAKPSTPTQPPSETDAAAKAAPTPPEPGPAAGADSSLSSVATKASFADADTVAAQLAFLQLGSREVEHYIEAFADLTADETRVMQSFDNSGFTAKERSMQSALVVYRLRTDPKAVVEYRDVVSVDGHEIKDHAAQVTKLWHELAVAHSTQEEIRRIAEYSERYDIGIEETGFTLFEGLPLRALCVGDFALREVRHEVTSQGSLRVFAYRQTHPCNVISYHFFLPPQFRDVPLTQAGEIALDAKTGQIVREDRSVYAGRLERKPPRVAHVVLSYGDSSFGILVPKTILIEFFYPLQNINMEAASFQLRARMVQTYGPFSRFEVSTVEKASSPTR